MSERGREIRRREAISGRHARLEAKAINANRLKLLHYISLALSGAATLYVVSLLSPAAAFIGGIAIVGIGLGALLAQVFRGDVSPEAYSVIRKKEK